MNRSITAGLIFAGLLVALPALALPRLGIFKEPLSSAVIDAGAMNASQYTGWIQVEQHRSIAFQIFFDDDGNVDTTGVTMSCQSSDDDSVANGAGYDIVILEASGTSGTSDSIAHTWSHAATTDAKWTWTVANLPLMYVNCKFDDIASGVAADKLTVKHRRISP